MQEYGRRPDLDSWCSRCVANGALRSRAAHRLGVGRTIAFFRAAVRKNPKLRIFRAEPAVVVHHCNYHGSEVEPATPQAIAAAVA